MARGQGPAAVDERRAARRAREGVVIVALTPQDVSRLADLARIELTEAELAEIAFAGAGETLGVAEVLVSEPLELSTC